jgi:hypothetical protein
MELKLQLESHFLKFIEIADLGYYNAHVTIKCESIFIAFHTSVRGEESMELYSMF